MGEEGPIKEQNQEPASVHFRSRKGTLYALLNNQQAARYIRVVEENKRKEAENPGYTLRLKIPSMWDVGLILPGQLVAYDCNKCNETYTDKKPKYDIYISDDPSPTQRKEGECQPLAHAFFKCNVCDTILYDDHIGDPELLREIPKEMINDDVTGVYVVPTPADIEKRFGEIEKMALEGEGTWDNPDFESYLKVARRLAGRVNYPITDERIGNLMETYHTALVAWYEKELPEQFKEHVNTEDQEKFIKEFFEMLPHIHLPEDIEFRKDLFVMLDSHDQFYSRRLIQTREEYEQRLAELKKEADERISDLEKIIYDIRTNNQKFSEITGLNRFSDPELQKRTEHHIFSFDDESDPDEPDE
jgi:hypothetical protein